MMLNNALIKDNILSLVDQYTLYQHYFPQKIIFKKNIYTNPFRKDRRKGSCHFSWIGNTLYFIDKATEEFMDVFTYIQKSYNYSFYESLIKINIEFNLELRIARSSKYYNKENLTFIGKVNKFHNYTRPDNLYFGKISRKIQYKIIGRHWNFKDQRYWKQYGISLSTLNYFNVHPIKKYYTNYTSYQFHESYTYYQHDAAYAYQIDYNDEIEIKIYRPHNDEDKWKSNCSVDVLQGYDQLDDTGDLLIITSSLKDVMSLYECGINAVAPNCENSKISKSVMKHLKSRFSQIIVMYDTDRAGKKYSKILSKVHNISSVMIPEFYKCKDFSDLVKVKGKTIAIQILRFLISEINKSSDELFRPQISRPSNIFHLYTNFQKDGFSEKISQNTSPLRKELSIA